MSGNIRHWASNAVFYHIYPLGLCGAPEKNDFISPPVDRLADLVPWLDHIRDLGTNRSFTKLCDAMRERGLRIVIDLPGLLDGVLADLLNPGDLFDVYSGGAAIDPLPPRWARILEVR